MAKPVRAGTWQFAFLGWIERFFLLPRKVRVMVVDQRQLLGLLHQQAAQRVRYRTQRSARFAR